MSEEAFIFLKYITIFALLLTTVSGTVRLFNKKASWSEGVTTILSMIGLIWISWI